MGADIVCTLENVTGMLSSTAREHRELVIAFLDLTGFAAQSRRVTDDVIADTLDDLYERIWRAIESAGGRTIKFIGDAALVVFPGEIASGAVDAILRLMNEVDQAMADRGWNCRLTAKVHVGTVVADTFGPAEDRRFDVVGREVNRAAMLRASRLTLSREAWDRLPDATRARFGPDAQAGTYVLVEGR
jgi:class 3 adenylate cyclase